MKNFKTLFTSWSLLLLFTTVYAEVKTPGIFSDRMVLQRESPIPLWGWAAPKETITITFAGKEYQTKANRTGDWSIKLPKHKAGGPYELKINQKQFQDVYVGDVYLCSGQSNMELTVKRVLDKYKNEIMCYENNLIRYTKTEYAYHFVKPQASSVHTWKTCTKKDALDFAALCYFFAKEMQAQEKVAIGIINSSWGGTNITAWLSRKSLEKSAVFRELFQTDLYTNPNYPDSIKTIESTQTSAWYRQLSENDLGKKENWIESNFDDSQWNQVDMFSSNWGGEWRAPINGVHYFRQKFSLPASLASQKAILRVGTIKDADETFINGVKVGSTSYEFPPRIYKVPENILRAGENEIVIRLISNSGRPTFIKDKLYQLELENKIIPLSTIWHHKIGCVSNRIPPSTSFQNMPTGLYNSMIYPLNNYAIRGIIWYQGESDTNSENSKCYESHLMELVNNWRIQWKKNVPFVIVQLANFQQRANKPTESGTAQVREAQRRASLRLKKTGLATAIDLGESNDIHPQNKKDLAHRCVLQINRLAFKKGGISEGPMPKKAKLQSNGLISITFLKSTIPLKQANTLDGFTVAGKDGKYKVVEAYTEGEKIIIRWHEKDAPTHVRYAWESNPPSSIYNTEGLPASSFQLPIQ